MDGIVNHLHEDGDQALSFIWGHILKFKHLVVYLHRYRISFNKAHDLFNLFINYFDWCITICRYRLWLEGSSIKRLLACVGKISIPLLTQGLLPFEQPQFDCFMHF